jgi:rod shape-determining protein MreD
MSALPEPRLWLCSLVGAALLFVQVHPSLPFGRAGIRPDLLFVFVMYMGIAAPLCRGACLCWALGYCAESLSGTNGGLWQVIYLSVFCAIKLLKKFFNFDTRFNVLMLFAVCQGLKTGILLFSFYYIYEYQYSASVRTGVLETLFTLLLFPVVFWLVKRCAAGQKEILFLHQPVKHGRRIR